jgi:NTP pyrophosphatase (non-canonical NTP hydrolase)
MWKHKHPERSVRANIRINVEEVYEVRHWAKQFGVSDAQLLAAVEQAGPLVDAVCQYFEGQGTVKKA